MGVTVGVRGIDDPDIERSDVRVRVGAVADVMRTRQLMLPEHEMPVADRTGDDVRRADEPGDERRRRVVVDLVGGPDLLDPPVVHDDDLVRELEGLVLVMRHEQARDPQLAVQIVEPTSELLPDARVQRPERLVQQQHLRPRCEGPRERHPLPLPAGQVAGVAIGERCQLDQLEQLFHALGRVVLRFLADLEPERHVLTDGHVPEQRVVLEHEPDAPLLHGCLGLVLAGQRDPACVRALQARDHAERGALPGTARTEQRGDLPVLGNEADVVDGTERSERLRQPLDLDRGSHLLRLLRSPMFEELDPEQQHDRERGQRQRDDVSLLVLVLLEGSQDVERRGLRLALDEPAHDEHGADLADRSSCGQRDPVQESPSDVREGSPAGTSGASRRRASRRPAPPPSRALEAPAAPPGSRTGWR